MTTSNQVTTSSSNVGTGGSYGLGFNYSITNPDYSQWVLPGLNDGSITQVLLTMMGAQNPPSRPYGYGTVNSTTGGPAVQLILGANIETPQPVAGVVNARIFGPVAIDNNLEGALSVDDWNIALSRPTTSIYNTVKNMLASANWLACGAIPKTSSAPYFGGIPNIPYDGRDRREIKLGRASNYFGQYVSGTALPGSPGSLTMGYQEGSAAGTLGQVFFNAAYNHTGGESTSNMYVVSALTKIVTTSGNISNIPACTSTSGSQNLEPYAQWITWQWMIGNVSAAQSAAQAVTNSWTRFRAGHSGDTAIFSGYGNTTRDLNHYCSMMRATGFWNVVTNGTLFLTEVYNALDALIANSASGLPQSYTCTNGVMPSTTAIHGGTPEPNMQYLLARNPFASNSPNGWFHA